MKTIRLAVLLALTVAAGAAIPARSTSAQSPSLPSTIAWYEDHWIDLSVSWDGAGACNVTPTGSECFHSESEMDAYLSTPAEAATMLLSPATSCSSSLRLYAGTSYTGTVLNLYVQGSFINLASYSFDNLTSSYKVGACSTVFYSSASGGGLVYTGDTSALAQAATMNFGWDNVVSSVYIS
jgi:hypothetical protein